MASQSRSRSRKGAWIEIYKERPAVPVEPVAPARERGLKWKISALTAGYNLVAPARERGLKFVLLNVEQQNTIRRSRKGAWIEMVAMQDDLVNMQSLPQGSVD